MASKIKDPALFKSIKEYLTEYLPVIRRRSDHTVSSSRDAINLFLEFICQMDSKKLCDVTREDFSQKKIIKFLEWLQNERGNKASTVNQRLGRIKCFCEYMAKNDVLSFINKEEVRDVKDVVDDEYQDFIWLSLKQVKLVFKQPDLNKKTGIRDRFFLMLLYESGCRVDEITHLKLKDFTINKKGEADLHVFGKGNKHRLTPLSKEIVPYFEEYTNKYHHDNQDSESWLFYTIRSEVTAPMSADNVQRFLKKYEVSARKVDSELPHLHPHLWRRTRAMHLYQAGVPLALISEWLGHSNVETTRIYARATEEMKREAQRKVAEKEDSPLGAVEEFKYADDDEILKKLMGLSS